MKKILFISFYFPPYSGVGSKRAEYWAKSLAKHNWEPTVLTSIAQTNEVTYEFNVEYLPIDNNNRVLNLISTSLIKDGGFKWISSLKSYVKNHIDKFNAVLITGGPFYHFLLVNEIKKLSSIPIILDYRDPFSTNPRINDGFILNIIKTNLEKYINKKSNICLTVNSTCAGLLKGVNKENIIIIKNGYDEEIINKMSYNKKESFNSMTTEIIYPGKVYNDFDFQKFVENINKINGIKMTFIGNNYAIKETENVKSLDIMSYENVISYIYSSDVGLILTGGKPFETPTKLFDYIGCNKPVLIVTENSKYTGEINEITKDLNNVAWASNDENSIKTGLKYLTDNYAPEVDVYKYSREYQFNKLINVLESQV